MKFKIIVATKTQLGDLSDFIIRQLTRRFNEWIQMDAGCSFRFRWVRENLIVEMDTLYLLQQWLEKERDYMQYLINPPNAQECTKEPVKYEFLPAA